MSITAPSNQTQNQLDKGEAVFLLIDHQPAMFFGIGSTDRASIVNNAAVLAKTAAAFEVPTVLTSINAEGFSGPLVEAVTEPLPHLVPIDRTTINGWDDKRVRDAVLATGRRQIVVAGLWTEACLMQPVLSMLDEGRDVYVVTDASGGSSTETHEMAVQRMIQAGARPATALSVLFELQRDFARTETVGKMFEISRAHGGAYGLSIDYAYAMLPAYRDKPAVAAK